MAHRVSGLCVPAVRGPRPRRGVPPAFPRTRPHMRRDRRSDSFEVADRGERQRV